MGVRSPNASIGSWALAVIAFSLGLGFDAVVLLLFSVAMIVAIHEGDVLLQDLPNVIKFVTPLIVLGGLCLVGLWLMLRLRKAWILNNRRHQWELAITIFVCVGAGHAVGGVVMWALAPA